MLTLQSYKALFSSGSALPAPAPPDGCRDSIVFEELKAYFLGPH